MRSPSSCPPWTSPPPERPTPSTVWRSSSRWPRAPRRRPRCTSTSRSSARCAWRRTPPTTCTTCSPCAGHWCGIRTPGRATSPRPSTPSPTAPTWCSPRTIGPPGVPNASLNSFPCSVICTHICTTRRCASSIRATPASRSPRRSPCRRRWRRPGTPTATTARSTTTSRPSISATWAGSTATPAGCGSTRRRRPALATLPRWAASTGWSRSLKRPSTPATSVGQQPFWTMQSSPTRITPGPAHCMPTPSSNSAMAPSARRGATSSCPVRPSCGPETSVRPSPPRPPPCSANSPRSRCSTSWPSRSTARGPGISTSPSTSPSPTSTPTTGSPFATGCWSTASGRPTPTPRRRRSPWLRRCG